MQLKENERAWMQAFTKGSKSAQARLSKIHANNPEFQDFVKKHGFGGTLSKKQAEKQKVSSVATVPPVHTPPEKQKGPADRETMIRQAAEKIRNRRLANANRVAFGGELGGGFVMPHSGFRTYREHLEEQKKKLDKLGFPVMKKDDPALPEPKTPHPVPRGYERVKDNMGFNVLRKIRSESKENRDRVMSYDSALVITKSGKLPKLTSDPKIRVSKMIKRIGSLGLKKLLATEQTEMSSKESLNELKKSTMASYLAKAGSRVRSGTSLGKDFEHDAYKDMAVANKHHPNMVTPGFEKDPEKLDKAEKSMKANFDLANMFKRDAKNRIKGIARAGRLLAKEEVEQLDERNTESHPKLWDTHALVHKSGKVLEKGAKVKGFRGTYKIQGFEMPHHSGSTGRVYTDKGTFFPGVVDAKIVKRDNHVEEEVKPVNEVSRGVIAKVATARYQQAQKALKDKDFGGYVKNKQKSLKAADATVPKSGWSSEDDVKKEEISPQEKYRKIRESLVRGKGK